MILNLNSLRNLKTLFQLCFTLIQLHTQILAASRIFHLFEIVNLPRNYWDTIEVSLSEMTVADGHFETVQCIQSFSVMTHYLLYD